MAHNPVAMGSAGVPVDSILMNTGTLEGKSSVTKTT